jgi:hypothetical protein
MIVLHNKGVSKERCGPGPSRGWKIISESSQSWWHPTEILFRPYSVHILARAGMTTPESCNLLDNLLDLPTVMYQSKFSSNRKTTLRWRDHKESLWYHNPREINQVHESRSCQCLCSTGYSLPHRLLTGRRGQKTSYSNLLSLCCRSLCLTPQFTQMNSSSLSINHVSQCPTV